MGSTDDVRSGAQPHTTDTKKIGVCHDDRWQQPEKNLRYDACITIETNIKTKDTKINQQIIPGGKFAIFIHQGPFENLDQTYQKIFNEWMPASKHIMRKAPILEYYLNCELKFSKPTLLKTKICIPID